MKQILLIAALTSLAACKDTATTETATTAAESHKAYETLEKADWLIGNWQNTSKEGVATESWQKLNDSSYAGRSYFVIGKDTVSSETINLTQTGDSLFYIPVVKGQNNDQPVKFRLTSSATDHLVFENPAHDFPQKISYRKISADSILAEISGKINGVESVQQFPMGRIK
jgi:hypothetical protein